MKKFLVTYHAPADAMTPSTLMTPEQQAGGMKLWMDWFQKVGDRVVDMGAPLMNSQSLATGSNTFSPSEKLFSGYTVIQAENMDEVKSLMEGHPHTSGWSKEATLEIHETMPLPGM